MQINLGKENQSNKVEERNKERERSNQKVYTRSLFGHFI